MDFSISLFSDTFTKQPLASDGSILTVLSAIKNGRWKDKIENVRGLNSLEYNEAKKFLPCVTFSGTFFPDREAENLVDYSSFMVLDIDKLRKDQVAETKLLLSGDPFSFAIFVSPSGSGLKVLVKIDSPREYHRNAFMSLESYYKAKYDIKLDASGKDVCRLCYISYDADLYLNEACETYTVDISLPSTASVALKPREFSGKKVSSDVQYVFNVRKVWVERKSQYVDGNKNPYLHQLACTLNRCGVVMADALFLLDQNFITPDDKWHQSIKSAYFHNKHEHNTVNIYELEKGNITLPPIAEEVKLSGDKFDSTFMSKAIELINGGVTTPLIKQLMEDHWRIMELEKFKEDDKKDASYMRALLNTAWKLAKEAPGKRKEVDIIDVNDMAIKVFNKIKYGTHINTFIPQLMELLGGKGLPMQNVYGLIGREGTFKSVLANFIGAGNSREGDLGIYFNGEMSDVQFYKRLVKSELCVDLQAEIEKGMDLEGFEGIRNRLDLSLKHNLHVVNQTSYSAAEITKKVKEFEDKVKKKVKYVIVDGISSMEDMKRNEVFSAIENSLLLKEVAKDTDTCVLVIAHTNKDASRHLRNAASFVRGGLKMTANFDGYFSTSLIVDKNKTNFLSEDVIYRNDCFYVRYEDKRETGLTTDFVMDVRQPLTLSVSEFEPATFEVELKVKRY